MKVLFCKTDTEKYAIPIKYISEIFPIENIKKYSLTTKKEIGLTNIRDNVVKLIDARVLFNETTTVLQQEEYADHKILHLTNINTEKNIGIVVKEVLKVEDISSDNIQKDVTNNTEFITGIIKYKEELIPLINISKFTY